MAETKITTEDTGVQRNSRICNRKTLESMQQVIIR